MADFPINVSFDQSTPKPVGVFAQKGSMGPRYTQDPMTSDAPTTGFVEADDSVDNLAVRGYKTPGTGGNDTLADGSNKGVSKSQMSGSGY